MAVGQLLDYRRFVDRPHKLAILLPEVPRPDLLEYLRSNSVIVIAPTNEGDLEVVPFAADIRASSAA